MFPETVGVDLTQFVESLAAQGRYHFTTEDAVQALGSSHVAARAALRRLRRKGQVAMPLRGFHVIVPPEYRRLGCLPPEQFVPQFMGHRGLDYYVGLLSAAEIHGAAHQRPQVFQVVLAMSRPAIQCGEVRVQFVARGNVRDMPTTRQNTPRGYVAVASPETTAFDVLGYARYCGGLSNVATVLAELADVLKADELARIAPLSPVPWSQRLGYLLELADALPLAEPLAGYVARVAKEYVPLNPRRAIHRGGRSNRWKILINDEVEPDL